jgi:hypothetical protein
VERTSSFTSTGASFRKTVASTCRTRSSIAAYERDFVAVGGLMGYGSRCLCGNELKDAPPLTIF